MFAQNQVILAEEKTKEAVLTITSHLHYREEKDRKSIYKGKIKFCIFEFLKEEDDEKDKKGSMDYFLPKKEAKYLFYRLLHGTCRKGSYFYGGKKGEKPIAKALWLTPIIGYDGVSAIEVKIIQGEGKVTPDGSIVFKEDIKRESVKITLAIDVVKLLAFECLDYIQNEEVVAQINGNPLYDQMKIQPISTKETPQLFESLMEMIEGKEEGKKEEGTPFQKPANDTKELINELKEAFKHYIFQMRETDMSKEAFEDIFEQFDALIPFVETVKSINRLR